VVEILVPILVFVLEEPDIPFPFTRFGFYLAIATDRATQQNKNPNNTCSALPSRSQSASPMSAKAIDKSNFEFIISLPLRSKIVTSVLALKVG
jgi:hypothetical protein